MGHSAGQDAMFFLNSLSNLVSSPNISFIRETMKCKDTMQIVISTMALLDVIDIPFLCTVSSTYTTYIAPVSASKPYQPLGPLLLTYISYSSILI